MGRAAPPSPHPADKRPFEDERTLLRHAKRGSEEAIEALVRSSWPDAYRVALGLIGEQGAAEEIAQEALLAAIKALPSFKVRRPFRPWLQAIVTNRALDALRARKRSPEVALLSEHLAKFSTQTPEVPVDPLPEDLRRAVLALPPGPRVALVLRYVLDFDSSEIAKILGSTPGAVRSTLHRARAEVRAQLEAERELDSRKVGQ
jgi:RNA polymerase sigma-70 factor, ECF subfamily